MNNDTTNRFRFVHLIFTHVYKAEEGINLFIKAMNAAEIEIKDIQLHKEREGDGGYLGGSTVWMYQVKLADDWSDTERFNQTIETTRARIDKLTRGF